MESLRLLQQGALRQILGSQRATLSRQSLRHLSQSAPRTQTCRFFTRPSNPLTQTSRHRSRKPPSSQPFRQRRWQSTTTASENEVNLSLSGRLRKLSREYGWSALGVYLLLSALDFPFCFLAVRTLGTDRIGRWEHIVLSYIKSVIPEAVFEVKWPWGQREVEEQVEGRGNVDRMIDPADVSGKVEMEKGRKRILEEKGLDYKHEPREEEFLDHGVQEAEKANRGDNASMCSKSIGEEFTNVYLQVYGHSSLLRTRYTSLSSF